MQLDLIQLPLASLVNFPDIPPYMIAIFVPIAGMIFAGVMGVSGMIFKHRQRELWHETARIALEKGQPLPPAVEEFTRRNPDRRFKRNDLRAGIILLAVSLGLYVFFHAVARDAEAIAAIPGCLGGALVLLGIIEALSGKKSDELPPRT